MNVKQYIKECVQEEMMRNAVRSIVSEELHRMWRNGELNESLFEKDNDDEKDSDRDDSKSEKEKADAARAQLSDMCDNPAVNKAAVAYAVLGPDVAHDSARHIFNDMLDGKDDMSTKQATTGISYLQNQGLG